MIPEEFYPPSLYSRKKEVYFPKQNDMDIDMLTPKVSVIVPVYNVENYLRQCLDSLVAQTLREIEFILVNDGSTDGSGEILHEYAAKYPQFKLIEQENKGYAGARNAAFQYVQGEYIGFVDSDDWIAPEMYETLYELAKENDADIAECSYYYYYEKDNVLSRHDNSALARLLEKSDGKLRGAEASLFNSAVAWNRIYRRRMMEEHDIRFVEEMKMGEDICIFWKSYCVAGKIMITPEPFYYYRNQRAGQQTSFQDERLFSFFTLFDIFEKFVSSRKLEYLAPWILHLRLSRYCYGYENASPEIKDKYFARMHRALAEAGITGKSKIAKGCMRYGNFLSHRLRYLILMFLHPSTLRAIINNDKKRLDRIIAIRLFLLNMSWKRKKLL